MGQAALSEVWEMKKAHEAVGDIFNKLMHASRWLQERQRVAQHMLKYDKYSEEYKGCSKMLDDYNRTIIMILGLGPDTTQS